MAALFLDFLPVLVFFAAYKLSDLMVATAALIVVTLLQAGITWARERKVNKLNLSVAALVLVFGGATLLLNDEMFIKWKPTVVYWLLAGVFATVPWAGGKSLPRRMLESKMRMPDFAWARLNLAWIAFFAIGGALNVWAVFTFSTEGWVNFKFIAAIALPVAFVVAQGFYLVRYAEAVEEGTSP